ncbi:acetoacetate decarboxylase [Microbacterium halimionae]|uniref:Acetoacetate decarboxylase n=1 Tax=Microbacterium halimionae TaxID=1526413 RepID=A0A7W3PL04_9MICO|nr:acetoacetate decarboxylase family protein [Microbacterium halimionae]MBA8815369.1 acetoacetate decarboxylase [Microbacterium halimionae]NII95416.1 acetoacetate decarboxylase [Microbacterium halimionae]
MATYPPEPWHLGGSLLVSVFRVPAAELPAIEIPGGRRPLRLGGEVLVGTAFANYVPGGVLQYNELLVSVPSVFPPRVTVPQIWVDSEASRAGGRELWGIPKQLETF